MPGSQKIVLKTAERIYPVNIVDIIRCESTSNYTTFYLKDTKKILVSMTLKEYSDTLLANGFFRTHKSHLINMSWIDYLLKREGFVIMKDNSKVPVASRKKQEFITLMGKSFGIR